MHDENGSNTRQSIIELSKLDKIMENDLECNWNVQKSIKFAQEHDATVQKFGRYPHRNEVLGRKSTDKEIQFLKKADTYG